MAQRQDPVPFQPVRRKKKRGEEPDFIHGLVTEEAPQLARRLGIVETESSETLPTGVSMSLANSDLTDIGLTRASRMLAKRFDVEPEWLLEPIPPEDIRKDITSYRDPVTGGELSLETARRLVRVMEPRVIKRLLKDVQMPGEAVGERRQEPGLPRRLPLDSSRVAEVMLSLAPIDGSTLSLRNSFGAAVGIAQSDVDLERFRRNLEQTSKLKVAPLTAISAAHQAALAGIEVDSVRTAAELLIPREATEAIEQAEAEKQTGEQFESLTAGGYEAEVARRVAEMSTERKDSIRLAGLTPEEVARGEVDEEFRQVETAQAMGFDLAPLGRELLANIRNGEQDFLALSDSVTQQIRDQRGAFARSPLGKIFGGILTALDYSWRPIAAAFRLAGEGTESVFRLIAGGPGAEGSAERNRFRMEHLEAWEDAKDIMGGRTTFGHTLSHDYGLPEWSGSIIEFGLAVFADPLLVAGRGVRVAREMRTIWGVVARKGQGRWMDMARSFIHSPRRLLGGRDIPRFIRDELVSAENADDFFDRVNVFGAGKFGQRGLMHRETMGQLYAFGKRAIKAGRGEEFVEQEIRYLMAHAYGARVPPNSFALQADAEFRRVAEIQTEVMTDPSRLRTIDDVTQEIEDARFLGSQLRDWDLQVLSGQLPRMLELPRVSLARVTARGASASGEALVEAIRGAVGPTGQALMRWGGARAEGLAKGVRALVNHPLHGEIRWDIPGTDYLRDYQRWGVSGRVFTDVEMANDQVTLSRILGSVTDAEREAKAIAFLEAKNREMVTRIAAQHGFDYEEANTIIRQAAGGEQREAFGFRPIYTQEEFERLRRQVVDLARVGEPAYTTQLANRWQMLDPIAIRRSLTNAQGALRRLRTSAYRIAGKAAPASKQVKFPITRWTRELGHDLTLGFLRLWKPWVVARPAYVWRVPILDEGLLRFNAAIGPMARMEATRSGAWMLSKYRRMLGAADPELDEIIRLQTRGRYIAGFDEGGAPILADAVDDIEFKLPGLRGDDDLKSIVSSGGYRQLARVGGEYQARAIQQTARKLKVGADGVAWGEMSPGTAGYEDWWADILRNQIGRQAHGPLILERIERGLGEDQIVDEVVALMKGRYRPVADRLLPTGWNDEMLRAKVLEGTQVARYYTGAWAGYSDAGNIARLARQGTLQADVVKAMPKNIQPTIHGLDSSMAFDGRNVISRGLSRIADGILAYPTNVINRHPFALAWKQRAEKALIKVLDEQGIAMTPEVRMAIENESRGFAATQVRQVLFDFRDQARIAEGLSFIMPFMQPFTEVFVSYSRIIRRNPAVLGWVHWAGRAAEESGFVQRDPDTGELMVPMPNITGLLSFVSGGHFGKVPGMELSSPLEAFNLFVSTTIPIPLGEGEVPVPTPGLSPPAMMVLWEMLEGDIPGFGWMDESARARLSSWAFEFGPPEGLADFFPTWMNNLISGYSDTWQEGRTHDYVQDFMRLQEQLGMSPVANQMGSDGEVTPAVPPPPGYTRDQWLEMAPGTRQEAWEDHREAIATEQARAWFRSAAVLSAFYPARVRVELPFEELRREFGQLADLHGSSDARRIMLERHPDLSVGLTIAGTTWQNTDNPVPIPATPLVEMLLAHPEAQDFSKRHPMLIWALIPREVREGDEIDPGSFASQLAREDRRTLAPEEWLDSEQVTLGWQAFFPRWEGWLAQQEKFDTKDISESDPRWIRAHMAYEEDIDSIGLMYPQWYTQYGTFERQTLEPNVRREAEILLKNETFMRTDAGQGLGEYWALRTKTIERMEKLGITSIETTYAERIGITEEFEGEVSRIFASHPDFEIAHSLMFRYDLRSLPNATERALSTMNDVEEGRFLDLSNEWQTYDFKEISKLEGLEQDEAWQARRQFVNRTLSDIPRDQNPVILEWRTKRPDERLDYFRSLMSRPYVYWTRFDRETVLREETNDESEAVWDALSGARIDIARQDAAGATVGPLYASLDRQLLGFMRQNPVLTRQVYNANDWGYRFESTSPFLRRRLNPTASDFWEAWVGAVRTVQTVANQKKMQYLKDDPYWRTLTGALRDYRDLLIEESPDFGRQWEQMEEENGVDDLLYEFVPEEFYFPLGGWEATQQSIPAAPGGAEARIPPVPSVTAPAPRGKPTEGPLRRRGIQAETFDATAGGTAVEQRWRREARTPEGARQVTRTIARRDYGWGASEFRALDQLWGDLESGWDWRAENDESSARGIPQAMMSVHFGEDWYAETNKRAERFLSDPLQQIRWGLEYIARKYGRPSTALAGWHGGNFVGEDGY